MKDFKIVTAIGAGIGLFVQPVLGNVISETGFSLRAGIFLACVVFAPFALFVAKWLDGYIRGAYQFAKFGAVGSLNNAIDFCFLNAAISLSGVAGGVAYAAFKLFSFSLATTNSFFWNKYWTFGAHHTAASSEAPKFFAFAAVGGVINVSIASFVVNMFGVFPGASPRLWANIGGLAGIGGLLVWDFVAYKFFVFKKPA